MGTAIPPTCQEISMPRTTLLTTSDIARIVATHGLPAVLSRMVEYLEADYRRWQASRKRRAWPRIRRWA
ncbi:ornithine cyclodeaminase [Rhodanobacter sp. 115]|nr:ornithine cyclodeaminase [Rhodanobacter sp. 115]